MRLTKRLGDDVIQVQDHGSVLNIYIPNGRFAEAAQKLADYEDKEYDSTRNDRGIKED